MGLFHAVIEYVNVARDKIRRMETRLEFQGQTPDSEAHGSNIGQHKPTMTVLLPNLAISGYRSFGKEPQFFERFSKINILIGRNNSGKSNILRAIKELLPQIEGRGPLELEPMAAHLPDQPPLQLGIGEAFARNGETGRFSLPPDSPRIRLLPTDGRRPTNEALFAELLARKATCDNTSLAWSFTTLPDRSPKNDTWVKAMADMEPRRIQELWSLITGSGNGDRKAHWEPQIVERFPKRLPKHQVELIPAIRRIGDSGVDPKGYDGTGIINRLARLQNPSAERQEEKLQFEAINDFLREVTDKLDARIEIPYARDTILVHLENKVLPIACLGSGLHEVIILAAAATTLSGQIVCIEEPELHLNPILQKKFIHHLTTRTENQYFITTHSPAIMDTPDSEAYHVTLIDGQSRVERVTSDAIRLAVCEDLGYHPSDLLLANCVAWVEGPSDRLYLLWWLRSVDPSLIEGIHFCVMYYGGKLAAHISNDETSAAANDFIQLRRLNRRGVILIDSDKSTAYAKINETKRRLRDEFDLGPGFAWITDGREVENYLPKECVAEAIARTIPSAARLAGDDRFDNRLKIRRTSGTDDQAPKVHVAKWITNNTKPDLNVLDLRQQLSKLIKFIRESNPASKGAA